jgi:Ca2+-transporting ATPase
MTGTTVADEAWHTLPGLDAAKVLHVEYGTGLSSEEAAARFAELGANRLDDAGAEPRGRALARAYRDAMQLVLVAAAALSLAAGEPATAAVVLMLTLVNAALALHEQGRPGDPVAALRRDLAVTARVRRDGRVARLPAELLVPGDMALVEAGEVVPADGRLVDSAALAIDESALTGESFPAAKTVAAIDDLDAPLGDRTGMAYMGTTVTGGTGELVVTATGMQTEAGRIARRLRGGERDRPARMPGRLLLFGGGALAVAAAIQLARGHDADAVATACVAFALAAVPSSLPAAVAALLAHGAAGPARAGATVRRPRAAAQLGTASALTVGTAGTLTAGRLAAVELVVPGRRYTVSDGAIRHVAGGFEPALEPLLLVLALAGDLAGGALAELAEKGGLDVAATRAAHPRVAELPFDAAYRLAATFHRFADEPVIHCLVAGAPEPVLSRTATDALSRERYLAESARLSDRGMTVVAIARRDLRPDAVDPASDLLPLADDLAPLALVGLADPPWPEARAAVARARAAGLDVWLVTGDRAAAAEATARTVGIAGRTITGTELAAMSDEDMRRELATVGVIARAEARHELRVVEALRTRGRVVAATGHRLADAPALAVADIGIATGPGVAAEAAAIVAADGRLAAIVRIVESTRGLRERLDGAIGFQLAAVAALILTFVGASALDIAGGMPLEPLQVLYLSFTAVLFQTIGLGYGAAVGGARAAAAMAAILAVATLVAMAVAEREHAIATVRTTGLVTFGAVTVAASLALRRDRALLLASAASVVALVLVA